MPVEESGNMLILAAALAQVDGNADFALKYWPLLERWAEYLKEKGLDPENQLCTDDFAGHLAHNANLSVKAILGLRRLRRAVRDDRARRPTPRAYQKLGRGVRQRSGSRWPTTATTTAWPSTSPAPGARSTTSSGTSILGLNLFPPEVARKEMAFYKTSQTAYGLPLDNRETYTKLDWILWTATLAETPADFEALHRSRSIDWLNETPDRVPLTDWYWTDTGKQAGFQARSGRRRRLHQDARRQDGEEIDGPVSRRRRARSVPPKLTPFSAR